MKHKFQQKNTPLEEMIQDRIVNLYLLYRNLHREENNIERRKSL